MTKRPDSKNDSVELTENDVVDYLEKHPDFFLGHLDLLKRLHVPHNPGKGASSLIERQVEVLRNTNRELESRLSALITNARTNEELAEKLHRYSLLLSASESVNEIFDEALQNLRETFDLDGVSVLIKPEFRKEDMHLRDISEKACVALLDTLGNENCSCHKELDDELLVSLFGSEATGIKSCALLALDVPHRIGLVALGSADRDRFTPQMGTMMLSLLGEQFSTALKRHHV
jgi:uncharacterized protein YigA (DUF484 family)